jgi:hypothetical protein
MKQASETVADAPFCLLIVFAPGSIFADVVVRNCLLDVKVSEWLQ